MNRDPSSPQERFGDRLRVSVSAETLQARIVEAETAALKATFDEVTADGSVARAAAVVLASRRRFIAGEGKSAAYAELLTADFSATLSNVYLVDARALSPLTVLTDVRSSDVLVMFSLRRYRADSLRFGELFRKAGGELVLITDTHSSPLAPIASATIRVHTGSASYADSPTAVAAVCQLLSALSTASAKGARRRLRTREQLVSQLGLHSPVPGGDHAH